MTELHMLNICFHGVGTPKRDLEPGEERYWVLANQFEAILDEIADWPGVRISFDDGNASDLEFGLPLLEQRGLRAAFFVLAGRLHAPGSLSEEMVQELHHRGMSIGSHGMHHRSWRSMDAGTMIQELVEARNLLSGVIEAPVEQAALPLGQYDRDLLSQLRHLGYSAVHTSDRRPARRNAWLQPRFSVRSDDSPESLRAQVRESQVLYRRAKLETVGLVKRLR